jgi:hypothetical protein
MINNKIFFFNDKFLIINFFTNKKLIIFKVNVLKKEMNQITLKINLLVIFN